MIARFSRLWQVVLAKVGAVAEFCHCWGKVRYILEVEGSVRGEGLTLNSYYVDAATVRMAGVLVQLTYVGYISTLYTPKET